MYTRILLINCAYSIDLILGSVRGQVKWYSEHARLIIILPTWLLFINGLGQQKLSTLSTLPCLLALLALHWPVFVRRTSEAGRWDKSKTDLHILLSVRRGRVGLHHPCMPAGIPIDIILHYQPIHQECPLWLVDEQLRSWLHRVGRRARRYWKGRRKVSEASTCILELLILRLSYYCLPTLHRLVLYFYPKWLVAGETTVFLMRYLSLLLLTILPEPWAHNAYPTPTLFSYAGFIMLRQPHACIGIVYSVGR